MKVTTWQVQPLHKECPFGFSTLLLHFNLKNGII